jgi:hypothetical protein
MVAPTDCIYEAGRFGTFMKERDPVMKRVLGPVLLSAALLLAAPTAAFAHDDGGDSRNDQHSAAAHREDRGGRFSREHPGDERGWKEEHSGGADDDCPYHSCEFNDCTKHVDNCER